MLKKVGHIALSVWLAILLLFGNTPKEFIHLFTDHTDTVDVRHDGVCIEKQHHHCIFLGFSLTAFANDMQFPVAPVVVRQYHVFNNAAICSFPRYSVGVISLRGPPVA